MYKKKRSVRVKHRKRKERLHRIARARKTGRTAK